MLGVPSAHRSLASSVASESTKAPGGNDMRFSATFPAARAASADTNSNTGRRKKKRKSRRRRRRNTNT